MEIIGTEEKDRRFIVTFLYVMPYFKFYSITSKILLESKSLCFMKEKKSATCAQIMFKKSLKKEEAVVSYQHTRKYVQVRISSVLMRI